QIVAVQEKTLAIVDTQAVPVPLNATVGGVRFLAFVRGFHDEFMNHLPDWKWSRLEVGQTLYDVSAVADDVTRVLLDTFADPGVQARNLVRLAQQEKINPGEQVDLRVDRWAFVRP